MKSSLSVAVALIAACGVLLALLAPAQAAVDADEIHSLPGWDGALPSRQWSGYFPVGPKKDRFIHYWVVSSERDPKTDDVVMWMNGGPGASSLIGFFTENGPFSLSDESLDPNNASAVPRLIHNPNSWATVSTMVFFESPAGVGFSYCTEKEDCWFNDAKTASDNYDAVAAFFAAYPEFSTQDFYITGESYAGIYIPTLVQQIEAHPEANINLKGFAIGDGCIGSEVGSCGPFGMQILSEFFYGQAFYSLELHGKILNECAQWNDPSVECQALVKQMNDEVGAYFVYNVYDTCGNDQTLLEMYPEHPDGGWVHKDFNPAYFNGRRADWSATPAFSKRSGGAVEGALNDYPCGGEKVMTEWLARKDVQAAIHVKTDVPHFQFNYTMSEKNLLPAYPGFIEKYRVLIYSGNVDACIPWYGSEQWTSGLGLKKVDNWRPWNYEAPHGKLVGGYVTLYENDFAFLTVKGSGHMVPQFKPIPALTMIEKFLNGTAY